MLTTGTTLGPYQILSLLGKGGMGEVYRARDTRLGRDVAVKVIAADQMCGDTRRFEQEARAAGALNHPNVCAVFDIGTHEGSPFVVMELLEGASLRARLNQGPIPARKAIEWAAQAAHGLAAAHEKGIVHRDLKPENLFLTKDGRVKVLDFGLAKLTRPDLLAPAGEETLTIVATRTGAMMGTAGYMAPEQVRGEPVDHRADLFALGAVVYELLTGRRSFAGETLYETSDRIVHADPPPLSASGREMPAGIEAIVRRCLEKIPEERFQSAKDLAFDLGAISVSGSQTLSRVAVGRVSRRVGRWLFVGGLLAAVLLTIGFGIGQRQSSHPQPTFRKVSFGRGNVTSARFSSDGNSVIYNASWDGRESGLFSTHVDAPEVVPLEPRNGRVASIRGGEATIIMPAEGGATGGTLATIPIGGGTPRPIRQNVSYADLGPDGKNFAVVVREAGRARLEYPPGRVLFESSVGISYPRISPDGNRLAFFQARGGAGWRIVVVDVAGRNTVLSGGWADIGGVAWSPDGSEVWFSAGKLWGWTSLYAVTLDRKVRPVLEGCSALWLHDIDRNGRVLVSGGTAATEIWGRGPGDAGERSYSWLDGSLADGISADGTGLLFTECSVGGGAGLSMYMRRLDGSLPVRLARAVNPSGLSADGAWAIGTTDSSLLVIPTGVGEPRTLPSGSLENVWGGFFPDGKRILITGNEPGRPQRLFVQDIDGGLPRPISPEGVLTMSRYSVSPDGTQVAAIADGVPVLVPTDGGEPRRIEGLNAGEAVIAWTRDGRSLFVVETRSATAVRVVLFELASRTRKLWRELTLNDPTGAMIIGQPKIAQDGDVYFYSVNRTLNNLYLVDGLR
jgi:serine/threonine protein kinase